MKDLIGKLRHSLITCQAIKLPCSTSNKRSANQNIPPEEAIRQSFESVSCFMSALNS